ncbi:S1C family serine protease [Streptomyces montanisoli]|uniref:Trypsin-like peptidase domain-containing protein n=1 Tax=Streptomyces montanisoli TaxID=2798581 RepID=A0A940M7A5_9ACTN|nr:trypsin-like peptidase domain-containing protein [Streptomyces montanisoli]MBP0457485.1 trypsin-like peptidase domain-containing protein [Streptomyces montanisoli]
MSTENEGTAGEGTERPATQSVPPGPDAAPDGAAAREATPTAEIPRTTSPDASSSSSSSSPAGSPAEGGDSPAAAPASPAPAPTPAAPAPGPYAQHEPPTSTSTPPSTPSSTSTSHEQSPYGAYGQASAGATPPPPNRPPAGGWPPPAPPAYPAYGAPGDQSGQGYGGGQGQDGGHGGGFGGPGGPGGPEGPGDHGGGPVWGAPEHQPPNRGRRIKGGLIAAVIVGALVAGGVGGGIGYWAASSSDNGGVGSTTVAAADLPKGKAAGGSVAVVAHNSLPSVVTIDATNGNGSGDTGTGFIFDKQGHILTNNHVVADAASGGKLTATFSNGKKYRAKVVGRAQGYDVAVIKLVNAPSGLKPLPLGNSDKVQVGDATIAIGAPFGLSNTVTTGIISAEHRPVVSGDESGNSTSYMSALQTDASINPGNSGGPLLDARGAVIGINSAIQPGGGGGGGGLGGSSGQPGSVGLGFAIPINQAASVAQQLIKTGEPVYPIIGATVTMDSGQQQGDQGGNGAVIASQGVGGSQAVTPGGPAAKAGLRSGDVITKFDGTAIDSGPTLISEIWTHKPGDQVKLTYQRNGQSHTVQVTLGSRKGDSKN